MQKSIFRESGIDQIICQMTERDKNHTNTVKNVKSLQQFCYRVMQISIAMIKEHLGKKRSWKNT